LDFFADDPRDRFAAMARGLGVTRGPFEDVFPLLAGTFVLAGAAGLAGSAGEAAVVAPRRNRITKSKS
jgi:hypothetical protein